MKYGIFSKTASAMLKPGSGWIYPQKVLKNGSQKACETPFLMGISAADACLAGMRLICAPRGSPDEEKVHKPRLTEGEMRLFAGQLKKNIFPGRIFNFSRLGKFCKAFSKKRGKS